MKYADIVIDNKSKMTDTFYTYTCDDNIQIGQKVYVPFAKSKNLRTGYVFDIKDSCDSKFELKSIDSIDQDICLNQEIINTCIWMKKRYLVKYIDGINCFVPPGKAPKKQLKTRPEVLPLDSHRILTEEQKYAVSKLNSAIEKESHDIFLIHGVTSSGKTEVYMQAIAQAIKKGKTAIMMVPEISLTKQVTDRFEERFGSKNVAIMHSRLTKSQRYVQWQRIRKGEAKIVIGARSAVFAPLKNIGIIVLDEEHESTYKSDMTPKYETLEVAIKRAGTYDGIVVLGSATPSAVSFDRAEEGIYKKIELKKRFNENPLPQLEIVDMAKEMQAGNLNMFSRLLHEEMNRSLEEKHQVILLLNRRGFSTYVSCRNCGYAFKCPVCGISLTYHKDINGLCCHYCGHKEHVPKTCPECGKEHIKLGGTGTQKLEEEVEKLFPQYTKERLDLDSAKVAGGLEKVLTNFRKRKTDILIGTQLVAKGLDFDNVGLVGIISADSSLNIPDYRSSEKTFQLITQAAGRAGRGDLTGKVIIQTYSPKHYAIKAAGSNNYEGFCREELRLRKLMGYPPYFDLIRLVFSGKEESSVKKEAERCYENIAGMVGKESIYYPQPAPINRINETYRYHMMIKCPKGKRGIYMGALDKLSRENRDNKEKVNIGIDVNPYSFI